MSEGARRQGERPRSSPRPSPWEVTTDLRLRWARVVIADAFVPLPGLCLWLGRRAGLLGLRSQRHDARRGGAVPRERLLRAAAGRLGERQ